MVDFMNPTWCRRTRGAAIGGVLGVGVALASGCSGTLEGVGSDREPAYKSSRSAPPLEVPPDLTGSSIRDSLQIPGVDATYSQYASGQDGAGTPAAPAVLPEVDNARIERSGDQRWLVVAMAPGETWPRLRDFWTAQGFVLETEEPNIGVMETEWAARQEPLPAGVLKRAIQRISDTFYGVAFRDRYRTRIERGNQPGSTDVYIAHRGAEQVVVGAETMDAQREGLGETVWQPRPNDPGLEAEMLARLMVFLGLDEQRADAIVTESASPGPRARLVRDDDGATALVLDQGFSSAWRRTGLALDRAGFAVEDRDRSRGLFYVRYAGVEDGAGGEGAGWLSGLMFWRSDDDTAQDGETRVVRVAEETPAMTRVVVLDRNGERDDSAAAARIIAVLHEQLE